MPRQTTIKLLRTTKTNLDAQKAISNLIVGEPYFITDNTSKLALATAVNDYETYYNSSEIDSVLTQKSDTTHNHTLASLSEKSYNSLTDKPTIQATTFHPQTDLNIDGNNGNFFLVTPPDNSSIGFSLSNISTGIIYYFLIGNSVGTSIVIPNTADKCVNHNIIVGANKYPLIAMIYTGTERIWTVSEELGL